MKVFLSYCRADAAVAGAITEDLRQIGHEVWCDRELTGGQAWWHAILGQIQDCDLFVFILTPGSLESQACGSELGYARSLAKRVLPVLCDDGVKTNLLPPDLSTIEYVDYVARDKSAAMRLFRALTHLPDAVPPPSPPPAEPAIPMSYLGGLGTRIDGQGALSKEDQSVILIDLKAALKDRSTREDATDLLRRLRRRKDLLAHIADEIDDVLARAQDSPAQPARRPAASATRPAEPVAAAAASALPTLPMSTIVDVNDTQGLEAVVRSVVASNDNWMLSAGEDRIAVSMSGDQIVTAVAFKRWGAKEKQALKTMGWSLEGDFIRNAATGALAAFGVATYGLGFALLGSKGTRDYLSKNVATKRFPSRASLEAALNISQAFRLLAGSITMLSATNLGKSPPPAL